MKLNAQINVLNKTIALNENKLEELRIANSNLEAVNNTLKENNKHYWRNSILIGIFTVVLGYLLREYL